MAGTGEIVEFSVAAMIEDVLLEHGKELCAVSQSKNDAKAKAATKRNEATRWIRKTVGVVAAKDLPSEPSEEDFRMGLRSGLVLCAALNKIERGAIPKMVGNPSDSVLVPDGEPLSESPYCENLTNFLEAVEQRGIPSFDIDDLEEWGRLPKVVNCILALNSYSNWKKSGGTGSFKFDGNPKPSPNRKQMVLKSLDMDKCDLWKDVKDKPLHMRIQDLLSDKKAEDIPVVIEIVLTKLIEEFERRLESHKEKIRQSKEKSEALARGRNEDVKSSPRDRHKEMEMKMKSKLKKEAFSIIKEMQRKAAANDMSNEIEKKTPTQTPKKAAASDGNKETEKKISMFAKKCKRNQPQIPQVIKKRKRNQPQTPKKSIADVFKKVENKPTTEAKKSTGDVSNQKPTTEAKKSTTDVNKQTEKKPPAETKKSISETEKKPTTEAKKSASDVKKPTTEAKKSVSDVNKVIEKKETTEAKKSISDVNKAIEKKETTEAKKSSDVNNQIEKKAAPTETKKAVSDVNIQTEKKAATEDKKSISDVDKDMEKKASTDSKKSTVAISDEIEEEEIIEEEEEEIEEEEEVEEEEEEEIIEADDLDEDEEPTVESEESEHSEDERHEEINEKRWNRKRQDAEQKRKEVEQKRKEAEEKKEMEKKKEMEMMELMEEMIKEMEGMQKEMEEMKDELAKQEEIENEKAMERRKELEEKKKERERKAAEDAKEEEYYNWVYAECNRLSLSAAKQQKLVEYQQKQLKVLKNIYSSAKSDLEVLRTKHKQEFDNIGKHLSTLAQHAAGYKKVVDENRKLYNLVQDLKGNIRVYCRSRPFLTTTNKKSCVDCMDDTQVAVITYGKDGKEQRKVYTFNRVFSLVATQAEVYKDTQPLIRSVLDGYNICIFAYGQTGSGKTHTMTGPENLTPELMGVNYRALNDLFDIQQQRKEMITYLVRVQMLEIYNEMVRDLLSPAGATKKYPFYDIRLGAADGINVPDAELIPVSTTEDVIRLMTLGHKNRAVGSTAMNDRSSRSHSCVTVHVSGKDLTSGSTVRGCMHLVDLAGSERADKTEATGDRLKEATHINKSLSALGDVIASLSQKNAHVPYRNSKLTLLLQDALGGQAKTLMFIHSDPDTVGETISTLKFAERVSTVELGAAKSNKDIIDLKELKDQVAALKAALGKDAADILNMEDDDDDKSKKAAAAPAAAKAAASAPAKSAPAAAKGKPAAAAAKGKPAAAKKNSGNKIERLYRENLDDDQVLFEPLTAEGRHLSLVGAPRSSFLPAPHLSDSAGGAGAGAGAGACPDGSLLRNLGTYFPPPEDPEPAAAAAGAVDPAAAGAVDPAAAGAVDPAAAGISEGL
ncbi:LOW QUALITY PROTEIN: hypothetical protein OSB04_031105, partial [Centaurea solstitialis]